MSEGIHHPCTEEHRLCIGMGQMQRCPAKVARESDDELDWFCSLMEGHTGPHIACSLSKHSIAVWGDTEGLEPKPIHRKADL